MEDLRAVLNVERSAAGRRWLSRCPSQDAAQAVAVAAGVPEIVGRLLAGRGVAPADARRYVRPSLKSDLPDPSLLTAMDQAAARLADAVERGERVAVFGDYDVDGAASSALLKRHLTALGLAPRVYIPDRRTEGYGPSAAAMTRLAAEGARLIVTVDCGTQSFAALSAARAAGAEVVVCDHHQQAEQLPEAFAIVNPNRRADTSGLGQLCAAGVALLMAVALNRELRRRGWFGPARPEPDLMPLVGLVALATVADVVPLTGPNRAFVTAGLKILQERPLAGLRALIAAAGAPARLDPYHLGFLLGPRVNAGGRVGDCGLGTQLLSTDDPAEAARLAAELDRLNRERQAIEAMILEDAIGQGEAQAMAGRRVIVLAQEGWHQGVAGIVAGRLKDRLNRPAVVIALEGGYGKGSARSVPGVDMGAAMTRARELGLLLAGGGHAMAAGLTVAPDKVADLRAFLEERLGPAAAAASGTATLDVDGVVAASGLTPDLAAHVASAGPYGAGNPEPVFVIPDLRLTFVKRAGQDHVRFAAAGPDGARVQGVAFRSADLPLGQALLHHGGRRAHLAGAVQTSEWNGSLRVELRLQDLAWVP